MISRLRETGLLWPALCAIPAFCVLIVLGNWQWSRMHWKHEVLHQLEVAQKAPPVPLAQTLKGAQSDLVPVSKIQFTRVSLEGRFDHEFEFHVWSPNNTGPAWSVVTPLRLKQVDARSAITHVLFVRGVVPQASKAASKRSKGQIAGNHIVVGRIRLDRPNAWAKEPDIAKNEWFTRDLRLMMAQFNETQAPKAKFAPFFVEAEQQLGGVTAPQPNLKALAIANRHLEYALTWWGLAATVVGVFAAFAWSRIQLHR